MTDQEFDVLDELYFVTSFSDLTQAVGLSEETLYRVLKGLLEKKWVRCYQNRSEEMLEYEVELENHYKDYYYLATKAGLLVHNGR